MFLSIQSIAFLKSRPVVSRSLPGLESSSCPLYTNFFSSSYKKKSGVHAASNNLATFCVSSYKYGKLNFLFEANFFIISGESCG